ncbi:hypothetical protein GCM10010331_70620 [Streptomyces xanthochromogenes]|uniref:TfuA-like protein n=1 Tax=Streptomyces xanthochromogenes TaxID=67384 RepID=UPI0016720FB4|nr:TfuA-like protein [Streptomyces xanthochromogenes]GHB72364.1 hypothetical protein GCM10010331_70620 [Streptomyces xanthochromogenes]
MTATPITLFLGPTAYGVDKALLQHEDVILKPPARRGDVERLLDEALAPGVLAIADGTFHAFPAVGHVEIRHALEEGWTVWGLCSMGAIRAAEMHTLGVRGFGAVYQHYADDSDLDDDEVALMHAVEAPHRPMSEPLIHLREFTGYLVQKSHLSPKDSDEINASLKRRWYADRTIPLMRSLLVDSFGCDKQVIAREIDEFDRFRLKQSDLIRFLEDAPWKNTTGHGGD